MITTGPFAGLPRRAFGAIFADPPWSFQARTPPRQDRGRRDTARHYPVMALAEIAALPVPVLAARDAHLFLWTSGPFLAHALTVIEAWNFRFTTVAMTWVKLKRKREAGPWTERDLHLGLGLTFRKNSELVLLARKGSPRRLARDVPEVILAPVREHSRKPDEAYSRVRRYCGGPYLELFAREQRLGWSSWGNEPDKFTCLD